jgi:hypothetical protein
MATTRNTNMLPHMAWLMVNIVESGPERNGGTLQCLLLKAWLIIWTVRSNTMKQCSLSWAMLGSEWIRFEIWNGFGDFKRTRVEKVSTPHFWKLGIWNSNWGPIVDTSKQAIRTQWTQPEALIWYKSSTTSCFYSTLSIRLLFDWLMFDDYWRLMIEDVWSMIA